MTILNNEITTPRQEKNGTRAFLCNRTHAIYTSHSNGYVRRSPPHSRRRYGLQYQLNKKEVTVLKISKFKGQTYKTVKTKRIMILNETDRLSLIERRAESYKPYYHFMCN